MKIAQISGTFPPYMAGTGNVCYHYSVELSKLKNDVSIFTSRYPDCDYNYPDGITVNRYRPLLRIGNAPLIPELFNAIDNFDLVHLHYPFFFGGELVYLNKLLKGANYVITYHNDVNPSGFLGLLIDMHRKIISGKILKGAKKIFVLSNDYTNYSNMSNIFQQKKDDLIVLPNGVDTNEFKPGLQPPNQFVKGSKILLFVGSLDKAHGFKGLEYLLRACSLISHSRDDFILLIIGEGELKNYYMDIAEKIGISHKVRFIGFISPEDLPKYYSMSDIMILPSIKIENFPLVLIEAMASGKPIITSNIPGVRTIIENYKNGLLAEPGDIKDLASKIDHLLTDSDLCNEIGLTNRRKAESLYSWTIIVSKLNNVYKSIM